MRIFFITSKLNFKNSGGSIEEFDLIIKTFLKLGNEVTVITCFSTGNDFPASLPYKIIEENIPASGLIGIQKGIYKILKKYSAQADFFQLDGHFFLYGAGLYRRLGGSVPVSAFFNRELGCWPEDQSSLFPQPAIPVFKKIKKKVRWLLERYVGMPMANGLDLCSFISPMYRGLYENFGLRKRVNNLVIGDPIDFKKIMTENEITENSYLARNKKTGVITLFFSSRMAPGKGFDVLLTGFSKVKNKDQFRLVLGGSGPEEPQVRAMIKHYDLEKYVVLTGWMSKQELYQWHKEADIFIQADWRPEGTSISLLYAMAFGIPSILPGNTGLAWIAQDSSLYFPYRDTDALAKRIEELGVNPEQRATLSANCYKRIFSQPFDHEWQTGQIYQEMKKIYDRSKH